MILLWIQRGNVRRNRNLDYPVQLVLKNPVSLLNIFQGKPVGNHTIIE